MFFKDYQLRVGSAKDKALLVEFMEQSYQELFPEQQNFAHLKMTVEQYYTPQTILWWVVKTDPIACLWMGNAYDQISGDRYGQIFLIHVQPKHRRRGIGKALLNHAQAWALARGDHQIGLYTFTHNHKALELYQQLGYQTQSLFMVKQINQ